VAGAFLPANTPGTIEHWMANEYYENDEAFLFAIAEAMREEYKAIVDAGFLLQIDDPDLPDGWACLPDITLPDYRRYAATRIDALNHALRDIPLEKIRLHVCWGSFHGPHHDDIPLKDIIDLIFRVRAGSYWIEASNPCHEHEWRVFENVKLQEGVTLVPGVVGHCTDFIEHPDLVAEALGALRQLGWPRECARRHRLRARHAGRSPIDLLGQVRGDGRRSAACHQGFMGAGVTDLQSIDFSTVADLAQNLAGRGVQGGCRRQPLWREASTLRPKGSHNASMRTTSSTTGPITVKSSRWVAPTLP
jgi:hypothetical protein